MQAIEFSTQVMGGNLIEVPFAFTEFLKKQKLIRVVLYFDDKDKDETPINGQSILPILAQSTAFDFLNAEEEDIYTDTDLVVKY